MTDRKKGALEPAASPAIPASTDALVQESPSSFLTMGTWVSQ